MAKRFYNPGAKFKELLRFDNPTNEAKSQNLVAYWPLEAEEESFFEVPTELSFTLPGGEEVSVPVQFWKTIKIAYAPHGVVLVDAGVKNPSPEDNVAATDKAAIEKASLLYRGALVELVREHQENCAKVRAAGMIPRPATNVVARALKLLGIEDPANDLNTVLQRRQDNDEVTSLKTQLAALTALVMAKDGAEQQPSLEGMNAKQGQQAKGR
jgi:hypothetical protein